jgi:hypothetical protein
MDGELYIIDKYEKERSEAADALESLNDELDIWKSVCPDIAPEQVLSDRSKLEAEIGRLRGKLDEWEQAHAERNNLNDRMGR